LQNQNGAFRLLEQGDRTKRAAVPSFRPFPDEQNKLWAYIKSKGLQDSVNKRNINADENLKKVFGGKATVSMFEMTKLVSKHLS
jgi:hypothetical protein